jgi:hypothetical protein
MYVFPYDKVSKQQQKVVKIDFNYLLAGRFSILGYVNTF